MLSRTAPRVSWPPVVMGLVLGWLVLLSPSAPEGKPLALQLRATPHVAEAPASIIFTAQLTGGADTEDLYCLTREWTWGDGFHSVEEGDCPPFEAGKTPIQRDFTTTHEYRQPGRRMVRLALRKGERAL